MHSTLVALAFMTSMTFAQDEGIGVPPASPPVTASRTVGNCKMSLDYSSPGAKGRAIFGGMIPFGTVWRTGANKPTTIEFSEAVNFGGKEVPAGKYLLATIPGKDSWTVILNKKHEQWGVYAYTEADDLARVTVKPSTVDMTECLDIRLTPKSRTAADLELLWEKTKIAVPITVDVDKDADKKIEEAIAKSPNDMRTLMEAGDYYLQSNRNLEKAAQYLTKATEDKTNMFRPIVLWRLAQVQWKLGKQDVALKTFDEAIDGAKAMKGFEAVGKEMEAMKASFQRDKKK